MLLYLIDELMAVDSGFQVFYYLTFRAILGALTALTISFMVGPWMIRRLSRKNIGLMPSYGLIVLNIPNQP